MNGSSRYPHERARTALIRSKRSKAFTPCRNYSKSQSQPCLPCPTNPRTAREKSRL